MTLDEKIEEVEADRLMLKDAMITAVDAMRRLREVHMRLDDSAERLVEQLKWDRERGFLDPRMPQADRF